MAKYSGLPVVESKTSATAGAEDACVGIISSSDISRERIAHGFNTGRRVRVRLSTWYTYLISAVKQSAGLISPTMET